MQAGQSSDIRNGWSTNTFEKTESLSQRGGNVLEQDCKRSGVSHNGGSHPSRYSAAGLRPTRRELDAVQSFFVRKAHEQGMCYHTADAAERKRLDRRVQRGDLIKPLRGMYADRGWWNQLNPIERHIAVVHCLARIHPDWVFCGVTAAALLGFSVPFGAMGTIHVARVEGSRFRSTTTIRFHRLSRCPTVEVHGIRVTNPERTAIDCMRTLPFADGLAIADSATRSNNWDTFHLACYLAESDLGPIHGICRARLVALMVDSRSENGGESIARASMIREGIALPELQAEVVAPMAGQSYRVDFAWRIPGNAQMVYGELDGRIKYTDAAMLGNGDALDVLLRERRRESELSLSCQAIVRFSLEEARAHANLARRLEAFGVPRVRAPLAFTTDARHNIGEIRSYLQANLPDGPSAANRLAFLEERLRCG